MTPRLRITALHKKLIGNAYAVCMAVGNTIRMRDPHTDELRQLQKEIKLLKQQISVTQKTTMVTIMNIDHINNYGAIIEHMHHNNVTVYLGQKVGGERMHTTTQPGGSEHMEEDASQEEPPAVRLRLTREPSPHGRRKMEIFLPDVNVNRLAKFVKRIHGTYYNLDSRRIEIGKDGYEETDFLLCLYYVLVKHGWASAQLAARPFYDFLTDAGICPQDSLKTYLRHLNKVVRTGKVFHRLTPELLTAETRSGTLTVRELPAWQRMFAAAEEVLSPLFVP